MHTLFEMSLILYTLKLSAGQVLVYSPKFELLHDDAVKLALKHENQVNLKLS